MALICFAGTPVYIDCSRYESLDLLLKITIVNCTYIYIREWEKIIYRVAQKKI